MNYAAPRTIDETVRLLADAPGAGHVLAGGTDLVVQMTAGLRTPDLVVDIKAIPELTDLREDDDGFHLGAALCGAALNENAALKSAWPGVTEAIDLIGSMQVQSRATPAGNLCNASPAADSVPALIAANATVTVIGPAGLRTVAVEDIPAGPGRTTLNKGEVITAIHLPRRPARSADAYIRFTPRTEMDIAVVGVAVNLTLDAQGLCTAARVAIGAVAPTARLVPAAGAALIGTPLDDTALDRAAEAVRAACQPIDDKRGTAAYRIRIAGVIFRRAALAALSRIS
ncbi:FAD binding domain-containing protein [Seohaeicola nanhaiensis]|uniref:FAD binding domain-containing protein n=1 Tax=Seohaeicola nanhaiensis TaxID=1387282 RepID=A0ABV9KIA5_9RHOB